ncbi:MAG: cobalamin biosynthesis protein CbiD [Lawsonibacter sp.]|nr:cobalamin biosynthesis protein CbiD [Lawsonibacter sp.]
MIRTENLSVGYGKTPLIEDICLRLRPGQIVTLIGPNGSGKSTILKTVIGQLAPIRGMVFLDGRAMGALSPLEIAQKLAVLMTGRVRPELMTCWDVAAMGRCPYTGRLGILSAGDREKVREALSLVHGEELAPLPFTEISDGQRQRVMLARALCQEPEVIVLDEPTTFLDIRYKLELLAVLKEMAQERKLAVLLSLHELELAEKISDCVVCVHNGKIERIGPPEEIFTADYIKKLFDIQTDDSELFVFRGGKRLRCGRTTGTCAALAAQGAARLLLTGQTPASAALTTPKGAQIEAPLENCRLEDGSAFCSVRKDGGDDIDATHGLLITAQVERWDAPGVSIEGGAGVGRVTKPGLDQSVGAAAINRVPRRMIEQEVLSVADELGYEGGFQVTIHVPGGEEAAKKTFNPQMGIEGGISILGTSGIVEPMSAQALIDTIALEIRQRAAQGHKKIILTPGNYGQDFLRVQGMDRWGVPVVKCSNFIGDALDACAAEQIQGVLLVGHMGKLVKLAGGMMNTHSRSADCRTELFCAHAALRGAGREVCQALADCPTSDACIAVLDRAGLRETVLDSLLSAIQDHLDRRVSGTIHVGAVVFSNQYGQLGRTRWAGELIDRWK